MTQITHLIPNTQFGQTLKEYSESDYRRIRDNLDGFVDQPLELYQFIPCEQVNGVWVPLEEPEWSEPLSLEESEVYEHEQYLYDKAKERCLFTGFRLIDKSPTVAVVSNGEMPIGIGFKNGLVKIEQLASRGNLPLTPTALKQIYG